MLKNNLNDFKNNIISNLSSNLINFNFNKYIYKEYFDIKYKYSNIKFVNTDKNLGLASIDLELYNNLILKHLSNDNIYIKKHHIIANSPNLYIFDLKTHINNDFNNNIIPKIYNFIKNNFNFKHNYIIDFLDINQQFENFKIPYFHILPKIHKPDFMNNPSSRPITAATSWITRPASVFLNFLLNEDKNINKKDHILINTKNLIDNIKNLYLNDDEFFLTIDIESLYTNIDTNVLKEKLKNQNELYFLLFNYINKYNYFQYDNIIYKQNSGLPMGINCAVNLANFYLDKILDFYFKKNYLLNTHIKFYNRYIDDIFTIFKGNIKDIKICMNFLNNIYKPLNLKFTYKYSKSFIIFLDLKIYKDLNKKIQYMTYYKEINKFIYLPYFSNHPKHTIKGFITGEINRIINTNSTEFTKNYFIHFFKQNLLKRNYPLKFIENIINDYITKRGITKPHIQYNQIIPFIIKYDNSYQNLYLKNCFNTFFNNSYFTELQNKFKIKFIYVNSNNKSLSQILINTKINHIQSNIIHQNLLEKEKTKKRKNLINNYQDLYLDKNNPNKYMRLYDKDIGTILNPFHPYNWNSYNNERKSFLKKIKIIRGNINQSENF